MKSCIQENGIDMLLQGNWPNALYLVYFFCY